MGRMIMERRARRRGRGNFPALAVVAGVALASCSALPDPHRFAPETPPNRQVSQQDVDYPNINNAPDRPSNLKTAEEQRAIEERLRRLGEGHVRSAQRVIETTNRRQ